jgi:23S rRNA pseudouridine1911/1915/1917 synthase
VHRLDKQTSGCLILAKTDDGQRELELGFEHKRIEKTYWALVLGAPPPQGACDTPYARDPANPRKYTSRVESPRRARLSFRTMETFADAALVEVALDTGRTHQIRVQLSELGYPVLADPIYGPKEARLHPAAQVLGRLALHARQLRLADEPAIEAPTPDDFSSALRSLRNGATPRTP